MLMMDTTALLGKDWEGHILKDNMLFVPEWRHGFYTRGN